MNYKIIYAKRKSVSIKVENDGSLTVRAPMRTPKKEIERIIQKHSARLSEIKKRVLKKENAIKNAEPAMLEQKLRNIALPMVEKYSRIMGKAPAKIKFTNAKTRFGSCNSKGTVCFSRYLALYPDDAIEYVVVHELAHLFEMNHSPAFYAIVEKQLPDWKTRKNLLNFDNNR